MDAIQDGIQGWGEGEGYEIQIFSVPCPRCGSHEAYVMPQSTDTPKDHEIDGHLVVYDIECTGCGQEL